MSSRFTHSGLGPVTANVIGETPAPDEPNLGRYIDALVANRWLIVGIASVVTLLGGLYALLQRPTYQANLVVQVEEEDNKSKDVIGQARSVFDVKTPAAAEIEIIRSRNVIGSAVDATHLYIEAVPRYAPYVGGWLARRATGLSDPGFLGMSGYVTGTEKIGVSRFDVPAELEEKRFVVTADGANRYTLRSPELADPLKGQVGTPMVANTPAGRIELQIDRLDGKPGAEFYVTRMPRQATIADLQSTLTLVEVGKNSGIVNVLLQGPDPSQIVSLLNTIGSQYVQQNVDRRAAEAQKSLAFLDVQLPYVKRQLEQSEDAYNRYRNQKGTVSLTEEATMALSQAVDRQARLLDVQQKRAELEARFTSAHPSVQTLDAQIAALKSSLSDTQARIKALPAIQQDAVRLERDLKVNTELYQSLLNNAMQLRLVKEGKVGNVRVLDPAVEPQLPIKPQRKIIAAAALALGLFLGVVAALIRNMLVEQRIRDPIELESNTGMAVFSVIPKSKQQDAIAQRRLTGATGVRLLAVEHPDDPTVESMRSLRTALQFAMLDAPSNRVLFSGATPGVGKSFVTANFAALLAGSGKKTLMIDADLRRGHLHQYLGLQRHGGLSELIAGSLTVQQTVHRQVLPNLDFLATGQLPPNPGELLTSESFSSVLEKLSESYDFVIIDAPPVLVASDAASIAAHVGTVLLVARSDLSTVGELRESVRRLSLGGKTAAGLLLNGADSQRRLYSNMGQGKYRPADYSYESLLPENQ